MKRTAKAYWSGTIKEGNGELSTQSEILNRTNYSFKTRFTGEEKGTNPEELLAAAHAGCFTMQLNAYISETDAVIEVLETKCEISLLDGTINSSNLTVSAKIEGISNETFQELVTKAEKNCPISKLFNTEITTNATLI